MIESSTKLVAKVKNKSGEALLDVYQVPRLGNPGDKEIKVRIIKQCDRVLIHITAPDFAKLGKAVKEILANDENTIIEWCGWLVFSSQLSARSLRSLSVGS